MLNQAQSSWCCCVRCTEAEAEGNRTRAANTFEHFIGSCLADGGGLLTLSKNGKVVADGEGRGAVLLNLLFRTGQNVLSHGVLRQPNR